MGLFKNLLTQWSLNLTRELHKDSEPLHAKDIVGAEPSKGRAVTPDLLKAKADTTARDNDLVIFNAMVANAVRYPHNIKDSVDLDNLLHKPLSDSQLMGHLLQLSGYEFGRDGKSSEHNLAAARISDTLRNYMGDDTKSIADLFDKVNKEHDVADLRYQGKDNVYYYGTAQDVNDAAAFVHNGDSLQDVINRSDEVFADTPNDRKVTRDAFGRFSDIEDEITDKIEFGEDEDFFKKYTTFDDEQFHSNKDVFNALRAHDLNVSDSDLHEFVDFAMDGVTDVAKEYGLSMDDVLSSYDYNHDEYVEDTLSTVQAHARMDRGASLEGKYKYFLEEGVADRVKNPEVRNTLENDEDFRDHYVRLQTRTGISQDSLDGVVDVNLYATNIHAFVDNNNNPVLAMDVKKRDDVESEHNKFDGQYITNRNGNHPHTQYLNEDQAKRFFNATGRLVDYDQFTESMDAAATENHHFADVPFTADVYLRENQNNANNFAFEADTVQPSQEFYDGADISNIEPNEVKPLGFQPLVVQTKDVTPEPTAKTEVKTKDVEDDLEP